MVTTAGVPPVLSSVPGPASRRWISGYAGYAKSTIHHINLPPRRRVLARLQKPTPTLTRTPARFYHAAVWPSYGVTTPIPNRQPPDLTATPFRFETGYALCAKRPSRPLPPPFLSPPSSSFSDPLTTQSLSQDKRLAVKNELIRGLNNGDDAILVAENFLGVDDGVGAWATRPHGHAA